MFSQSKEDVWRERCFLCSCPLLPTMGPSNSDNHNKVGMEIVFKYLLSDSECQEVNLKKSLISSSSLFELCNSCEQLTTNILNLHLQLEVMQMKIIEKLKKVKTLVSASANWEHGLELEDECGRKERNKMIMGVDSGNNGDQDFSNKPQLRAQFQALICENDKRQVEIPLVHLEKFAGGSGHLPQSISNSPHVPAQVVEDFKTDVATQDCSLKVTTHLGDHDHSSTTMLQEAVSAETTNSQSQQVHLNGDSIMEEEEPRDPLSPLNSPDHSNSEDEGADAEVNSLSEEKSRQLLTTPAQKVLRRSKLLKRERGGKKCGCMYLCHQCLFVSGNSFELEGHYRRTHETGDKEKSHKCPQCSSKFSTEPALALHIHIRHNPLMKRVAVCEFCGKFSTKLKNCWEAHLNRVHPHDKRYKCELCGSLFGNYTKLIEHSKSRHRLRKLKCGLCPKTSEEGPLFNFHEELPRHIDEVHGLSEFRLECDIPGCSQRYYFHRNMKKHKERVHQTSFQCKKCSLNFSSYSDFLRHNVDVHNLNKYNKCDMCPQRFNYPGALLTHKIVEHNFPALRCELCPSTSTESFTSNQALRIHLVRCHPDHEEKGGFGCSVCSKQFKSEVKRKQHELTHATTKDFSCDKCDFATTTKINLQMHSSRRHSTTGFSCESCGFATMAKANLRAHMKRHEKPYECSECHKKFGSMNELKQHMHTHGEERNFQCHLCGRSFKHKPSLLLHNRNAHSKKRMGDEEGPVNKAK